MILSLLGQIVSKLEPAVRLHTSILTVVNSKVNALISGVLNMALLLLIPLLILLYKTDEVSVFTSRL